MHIDFGWLRGIEHGAGYTQFCHLISSGTKEILSIASARLRYEEPNGEDFALFLVNAYIPVCKVH